MMLYHPRHTVEDHFSRLYRNRKVRAQMGGDPNPTGGSLSGSIAVHRGFREPHFCEYSTVAPELRVFAGVFSSKSGAAHRHHGRYISESTPRPRSEWWVERQQRKIDQRSKSP
jgi:hypothetical protein